MRFSLKAILFAPLAVPILASGMLSLPAKLNPREGFLFLFLLFSAFSYGVTIFLLLPCLFVLSRFTALTFWLTALVGTALGGLVYLAVAWQSYLASGVDSGPPSETFAHYLWRSAPAESWMFLLSGLITALLYFWLAKSKTSTELRTA